MKFAIVVLTKSPQASVRFVKTVSVTVTLYSKEIHSVVFYTPNKQNQLPYQSNTTNDSRKTKLQNYNRQSLQVQISVLLKLFKMSNKVIKENDNLLD